MSSWFDCYYKPAEQVCHWKLKDVHLQRPLSSSPQKTFLCSSKPSMGLPETSGERGPKCYPFLGCRAGAKQNATLSYSYRRLISQAWPFKPPHSLLSQLINKVHWAETHTIACALLINFWGDLGRQRRAQAVVTQLIINI